MTTYNFINHVFLTEYKDILEHPYIAFSLIFTGIEFLGKCLDEDHEFDDYSVGLPKKHFNKALQELFPRDYSNYKIYEFLRNGFAHMVRPKSNSNVRLGERKNIENNELRSSYPNFVKVENENIRILFIEDFYEDFAHACRIILARIEKKEFKHEKMYATFLPIKTYTLPAP